jgi:DNA primase
MSLDVRGILDTLKLDVVRERGDEILCHCPVHVQTVGKEDRNPSFWINKETGANICFSCGWKGGVFSLVGTLCEFYDADENIDYTQVKQWIATASEITVEELGFRLRKMPEYVTLPEPVPMSEARLALFTEPPQWALEKRMVSAEAAKKHEVLWNKDRWIVVIRDADGNLMGWQEKSEVSKEFKNRPTGIKKSATLFGIQHMLREHVIVVESPLDVVRLETVGVQGAVATFGALVSDAQRKLLGKSDLVIAAFDNPAIDPAGKKACDDMLVSAKKYGMELKFFNYNNSKCKDVGEMSEEDIKFGLMTAKDMIYGERAYV